MLQLGWPNWSLRPKTAVTAFHVTQNSDEKEATVMTRLLA
jgi:hypothetical protein